MYKEIIDRLPYKSSFLFVDNILSLSEEGVTGDYTLKKDAFFYEDHFVGYPVTPGVIITEIMAQIGLVVLAIYLINRPAWKTPGGEGLVGERPEQEKPVQAERAREEYLTPRGGNFFPLLTSTDIAFNRMVLPGEKVTVISRKEYFRFGKLKCHVEMHNTAGELVAKGIIAGIIKQH